MKVSLQGDCRKTLKAKAKRGSKIPLPVQAHFLRIKVINSLI